MERAYNDLDFAIGNEAGSSNKIVPAYNKDAINIDTSVI
jgi:hypothetical protein